MGSMRIALGESCHGLYGGMPDEFPGESPEIIFVRGLGAQNLMEGPGLLCIGSRSQQKHVAGKGICFMLKGGVASAFSKV